MTEKMIMRVFTSVAFITALLALPASAQEFYAGKTVTIVVGSAPGGSYDLYARLIAQHIGKYIPGNPNVIVSNMPGAASNTSLAHLYNVAPRDGTVIGAPQNSAITDALFDMQLGNARKLRHDATKLIQIGSATSKKTIALAPNCWAPKNFVPSEQDAPSCRSTIAPCGIPA